MCDEAREKQQASRAKTPKRYDVPYNCKFCARAAPPKPFEPEAEPWLLSHLVSKSFQAAGVNMPHNDGYMVRRI